MSTTGRFLRSLLGGSATGPTELPLSTYGKLPIYKDFLRSNLAGPEAVAVKAWLDRGFSRFWEGRESCRDARIETHAFLLLLPDTSHYVLGNLWGSHDSGGLRRFPFTVFGTLEVGKGASRTVANLLALGGAARELRTIQETLQGLPSVEAFNERARRLTVRLTVPDEEDVEKELRHELAAVTEGAFATSIYGAEAPSAWPGLLGYLARVADLERAGRLAVRLPASDLLPVHVQAAMWARLVLGEDGRRRPAMSALFTPANHESGVVLLDRFLRPDDVLLFNPGLSEYEFVEDLRKAAPRSPGAQAPVEPGAERPLSALIG